MFFAIVIVLTILSAAGVTWAAGGFGSLHFLWELPLLALGFYALYVGLTLACIYLYSRCKEDLNTPAREEKTIRWIIYKTVDFIFKVLRVKFHMTGLEQLPKEGRMMVVCNHISLLDPLAVHKALPQCQLAFISKKENNDMPMVNYLMHGTNCQMLDRENDREALKVILKCIDLLKEDACSIGVFPEGYTSKDGHLQPFRNGVFKIAQRAQVPIVVCTVKGTNEVFQNFIHLRRSHVYLDLLGVVPAAETKGVTRIVGDRVHLMMEQSLGEMGKALPEATEGD